MALIWGSIVLHRLIKGNVKNLQVSDSGPLWPSCYVLYCSPSFILLICNIPVVSKDVFSSRVGNVVEPDQTALSKASYIWSYTVVFFVLFLKAYSQVQRYMGLRCQLM